jgi:hypothetical protein
MSREDSAGVLGLFVGFIVAVIICAVIFICLVQTTAEDQSRRTQQCDVVGESLGCQRNSSWVGGYNGRCSCAMEGGSRIEYDNTLSNE